MLKRTYLLQLEQREDGGLRICSPDIPGLFMAGPDPATLLAATWEVMNELIVRNKVE